MGIYLLDYFSQTSAFFWFVKTFESLSLVIEMFSSAIFTIVVHSAGEKFAFRGRFTVFTICISDIFEFVIQNFKLSRFKRQPKL